MKFKIYGNYNIVFERRIFFFCIVIGKELL